jgi:hypothetical protein
MKILAQPIPFEKVLFLFILIFNLIAIALINTFDSFIQHMLYTDVLILALIKGEKAIVFLITIKYQKK